MTAVSLTSARTRAASRSSSRIAPHSDRPLVSRPLSQHAVDVSRDRNREHTDRLLQDVRDDLPLDEAAVQAVVLLNLGLADGIAGRYLGRGIDREDLVQVARLGLVKAVRRFRPGLGQSFAGFAAPTISGEIKRHFRDTGWVVRPPRRLQELGARLRHVEKELEQQLHRRPTNAELASALGVEPADVHAAREAASSFHALSLDVPATIGHAHAEGSLEEVEDPFSAIDNDAWLSAALADISERERLVLRLRFVDLLTQSEIATQIGVSQMQVSRILRGTLHRLRNRLESSLESAA
jgi:RNA polymerase sigma-B factor